MNFLTSFDEPLFVKVGMELFYREGPVLVEELKAEGHQVFLDLKLHDIPTTVERAMTNLAKLEVDLVNVHALGGQKMMSRAREGLEKGTAAGKRRPSCIAVTHLTSTDETMLQREWHIHESLQEHVLHLASLSNESGMDGVVCSALEAKAITERLGKAFLTVTPGIRLASDDKQDQQRVVTPAEARKMNCSAIVVGRGITRADAPKAAYTEYLTEWRGSHE
ncbi:orotidine-5'-phosphate decarboxylase [Alteribacter populi]|uniref:orotidine-5'-phosphate decarboxylase n=1 Tax=Alteribacter populi TaxID=2011011 RepID=UPI001FE1E229|nr:orotidine-5'-phosphate decarboxylase [Alteribacter populi]